MRSYLIHFLVCLFDIDSEIFCYGPLLHNAQMSHLFKDSKTFVDMKLKQSPEITLKLFHELLNKTEQKPSVEDVKKFVSVIKWCFLKMDTELDQ